MCIDIRSYNANHKKKRNWVIRKIKIKKEPKEKDEALYLSLINKKYIFLCVHGIPNLLVIYEREAIYKIKIAILKALNISSFVYIIIRNVLETLITNFI